MTGQRQRTDVAIRLQYSRSAAPDWLTRHDLNDRELPVGGSKTGSIDATNSSPGALTGCPGSIRTGSGEVRIFSQ
jgi:hypothetical protein